MSKWIRFAGRLLNTDRAVKFEVWGPYAASRSWKVEATWVDHQTDPGEDEEQRHIGVLREPYSTEAEAQARFDEIEALLIGDSPDPPPRRKVVRG